ncbi:MAG TPA: hypothetical protein VK821_02595 [Dehalococcoidia bacterium]|nr:hypothetical protein [Dehalococcoidia bacterium]
MSSTISVFPNTASWYHNASFLLPLTATGVVALYGSIRRSFEILGFAAFLAVVTLAMVPVVLAGWRQTATAVVVTREAVVSLHNGRVLKSLEWVRVRNVRRRETQGNVRWEIGAEDGEALLLDGELADLPRLIGLARELSGAREEHGA